MSWQALLTASMDADVRQDGSEHRRQSCGQHWGLLAILYVYLRLSCWHPGLVSIQGEHRGHVIMKTTASTADVFLSATCADADYV
eukprot:360433-Chlamydomonas_euryale.AAC.3